MIIRIDKYIKKGEGFKLAMETLDEGRVNIATVGLGIARAAFECALSYAKTRVQFGRTIGTFQALNFMLVDMAAAVESARLLTWYAGSLGDQRLYRGLQGSRVFRVSGGEEAGDQGVGHGRVNP
jgi:alkylation response protein AidB-like acyl-CoA dehydrogenase